MGFPKNKILERAIQKKRMSIRTYCKSAKFDYSKVMRLIQLRDLPTVKGNKERYRPICIRISIALNKKVERLFPLGIYDPEYYAEQIKAAAAEKTSIPDVSVTAAPRTTAPDEIYEAKKRLQTALSRLSEREARFLMRHLFREETLAEIGKAEGVSPERARQIIIRATGKIKKEK